jgi:AcrR family transcriptional regulator
MILSMAARPKTHPMRLTTTANAAAPRRGRPRTIHRDNVIRTALAIVDHEGLAALTIRRLAEELGVGIATIYGAAGDKEEILGALVDTVLSELELPAPTAEQWDEALVEFIASGHEALLRHPAVAQLAALQPVRGPVVLRVQETILELLRAGRLDDHATIAAYTAVTSFLMGFTLLRASRAHLEHQPERRQLAAALSGAPAEDLPELRALAPYLYDEASTAEFTEHLRRLILSFAEEQPVTLRGRRHKAAGR